MALPCLYAAAKVETNPQPIVSESDFTANIEKAEAGEPAAARIIGDCYLTGTGVSRDVNKAWRWYSKAAGKQDLEARYRIACLYRDGIGVKQNDREAAYWFGRAANNGHPLALLNIADCYIEGRGIQRDDRIAAEDFWRAPD